VRPSSTRPAVVEVDLGRLRANARVLADLAAPAELCAVVKADAYGHGARAVAPAAVAGGARALAVATVDEGLEVARLELGVPILVLSEPTPAELVVAFQAGLRPTIGSEAGLEVARAMARPGRPVEVEVAVDTGMHREGVPLARAEAFVDLVAGARADGVRLAGLWSHLAVADRPGDPFNDRQLADFGDLLERLRRRGVDPGVVHVANSATLVGRPEARFGRVRTGLLLYGYGPADLGVPAGIEPVLSLRSEVRRVADLAAGAAPSYGRRRPLARASRVATVPVGYADGLPWGAFPGGGGLIGGVFCPLAGAVTMDQIILDCGDAPVEVGDEVVVIGRQRAASIGADTWAAAAGTITYEILCRLSGRLPRALIDPMEPGPSSDRGAYLQDRWASLQRADSPAETLEGAGEERLGEERLGVRESSLRGAMRGRRSRGERGGRR